MSLRLFIIIFPIVFVIPSKASDCGKFLHERLGYQELLINQSDPQFEVRYPGHKGLCGPTCGANILQLMRYVTKGDINGPALDDAIKIIEVIESAGGKPTTNGTEPEEMFLAIKTLAKEKKIEVSLTEKKQSEKQILQNDFNSDAADIILFSVYSYGNNVAIGDKPYGHWLIAIPDDLQPGKVKIIDPNYPDMLFSFTMEEGKRGESGRTFVSGVGKRPRYLMQKLQVMDYLSIKLKDPVMNPELPIKNSPFANTSQVLGQTWGKFMRMEKNSKGVFFDPFTNREIDRIEIARARNQASLLIFSAQILGKGRYKEIESEIEFTASEYDDLIFHLRSQ